MKYILPLVTSFLSVVTFASSEGSLNPVNINTGLADSDSLHMRIQEMNMPGILISTSAIGGENSGQAEIESHLESGNAMVRVYYVVRKQMPSNTVEAYNRDNFLLYPLDARPISLNQLPISLEISGAVLNKAASEAKKMTTISNGTVMVEVNRAGLGSSLSRHLDGQAIDNAGISLSRIHNAQIGCLYKFYSKSNSAIIPQGFNGDYSVDRPNAIETMELKDASCIRN